VIVLDHLTPAQRRAYLIADNKLAELAGWDHDLLRSELQELQLKEFDLGVIGFSDEELAELLADDEVTTGLTDEDAVPDVPERPVTVTGDLWVLDDHRVLCGDATDLKAVRKLVAGEQADLVFTDPPYNVDYEGYTADKLTIKGDKMKPAEFDRFLRGTFASYRAVVKQGASMYVCHASSVQREFQNALEASGFEVRCQIIWAKNTFAWGHSRYKFQHEPIFYCHRAKQSDPWYGDKSQSTLWQEKKPAANRLHPTMKPIELIGRALLNSSKGGDCVLDLFGGSGSTLIACERRNRKSRLMELDPKYADVIVKRWQEYTGQGAVLARDGRNFEEVGAERLQ
jgi:DNA modification methylase